MRILAALSMLLTLSACSTKTYMSEPTFNERTLRAMKAQENNTQDALNAKSASADPNSASLWSKSEGNPYLIRNQKAQNIGDLLTIIVDESATATTSANTNAKKDSKNDLGGTLGFGQGASNQVGTLSFSANNKNEFKGEGKTDRSGRLQTTVQAVVENTLKNGTLFVRGRKVITINNEDQEVEISGFVRPDDIRINNTVISSVMADAKIRYVGDGVISDKQRTGWGTRLVDAIWPF